MKMCKNTKQFHIDNPRSHCPKKTKGNDSVPLIAWYSVFYSNFFCCFQTHVDEIRKVKSAARALLRHTRTKQLPDERFFDLVSLVDDYFVGDPRYKGLSMIQLIQIGSQLCET
jgi:hypothetical protein